MIKIKKSNAVPKSLKGAVTKKRRDEIILNGKYPTSSTISEFDASTVGVYDGRYKSKDIKASLAATYKNKCAFCEQKVEQWHVEHFRPKSIYYWLAFSWDNLLYCCHTCNQNKSNKFPHGVNKTRANILSISTSDIHNLGDKYDRIEENQFVNPEKEDVSKDLVFQKNGFVSSAEARIQTTISELKVDRAWLNEQRELIYKEFEEKVSSRKLEYKSGDPDALIKLEGLIEDFIKDGDNEIKEFLSFRKYIVNNWLRELIS